MFCIIGTGVEEIMKILSVNAGSSSLKFTAFEMPEEKVLASGNFERIGINDSLYTIKINGEKIKKEVDLPNHTTAFKILMDELIRLNVVSSLDEIKGIGHRVVQGADHYDKSVIATDEVVLDIDSLSSIAPLHNPAAVLGIKAAKEVVPLATEVVVFDTAFHQSMPKENYLYAIPMEWYHKYQVRRYGAHGTSHKYIALEMAKKLGRDDLKLIVCHIGSGASVTAIKNGKSFDTSMGFTPNAGLIMGTRCGDTDVTAITYIMDKLNISPKEMDTILNKKSGMLGVSGISSDGRDVEAAAEAGNKRAILTQKIYVNSIVETVSGYYGLMGGADAIVFAGGIGENDSVMRQKICNRLSVLGVKVPENLNIGVRGIEKKLSSDDSKISVWLIPTNEELVMARDAYANLCDEK